jgi:hypothetical protein
MEVQMHNCNKCGADNPPGSKFCGGCGSPIMSAGVSLAPGGAAGGGVRPAEPTRLEAPGPGGGASPTVHEGGPAAPTAYEGGRGPLGATVYVEDDSRRLAGFLVVLRGRTDKPYTDFPLYEGKNPIGHSAARPQISLEDQKVSREHATVMVQHGQCTVIDVGSSNGTFVNDKKVLHEELKHGDKVRLGGTTLVFVPIPTDEP